MWQKPKWTDLARCRGFDPEIFFPVGSGRFLTAQVSAAKEVCSPCPVRRECLGWALRSGEPDGIWGGSTPEERRRLRRHHAARGAVRR